MIHSTRKFRIPRTGQAWIAWAELPKLYLFIFFLSSTFLWVVGVCMFQKRQRSHTLERGCWIPRRGCPIVWLSWVHNLPRSASRTRTRADTQRTTRRIHWAATQHTVKIVYGLPKVINLPSRWKLIGLNLLEGPCSQSVSPRCADTQISGCSSGAAWYPQCRVLHTQIDWLRPDNEPHGDCGA